MDTEDEVFNNLTHLSFPVTFLILAISAILFTILFWCANRYHFTFYTVVVIISACAIIPILFSNLRMRKTISNNFTQLELNESLIQELRYEKPEKLRPYLGGALISAALAVFSVFVKEHSFDLYDTLGYSLNTIYLFTAYSVSKRVFGK